MGCLVVFPGVNISLKIENYSGTGKNIPKFSVVQKIIFYWIHVRKNIGLCALKYYSVGEFKSKNIIEKSSFHSLFQNLPLHFLMQVFTDKSSDFALLSCCYHKAKTYSIKPSQWCIGPRLTIKKHFLCLPLHCVL